MIRIRNLEQRDIEAVHKIESSTASAWNAAQILQELQVAGSLQLVVELFRPDTKTSIVGWCAARFIPPEAELLKITLKQEYRTQGIGSLLLNHLVSDLEEKKISTLFLEVRAQNRVALKFYYKHNFTLLDRRKNYYSKPQDDAFILEKVL